MGIKYVCRCRKCGKTRESYNDPRLRKSVIECKSSCFESHYEWDFVNEYEEGEQVAAAPQDAGSSSPTTEVAASPTTQGVASPQRDRPPVKQNAFVEEGSSDAQTAGSARTEGSAPTTTTAAKDESKTKQRICTML